MIGIMVSVTVIKFVLMIYCRRFKNEIVRAYAQDHLFDVVTNSVGLITAVLAIRFYWWIDPTGAIIVSKLALCFSASINMNRSKTEHMVFLYEFFFFFNVIKQATPFPL